MSFSDNDKEVIRWLAIAFADADSVKVLAEANQPENALYHMQQVSEKLLKAFILHNGGRVKPTHQISALLLDAVSIDVSLVFLAKAGIGAEEMGEMSTFYRYPNQQGLDSTTKEQFIGALTFMSAIRDEILPKLPAEIVTFAQNMASKEDGKTPISKDQIATFFEENNDVAMGKPAIPWHQKNK